MKKAFIVSTILLSSLLWGFYVESFDSKITIYPDAAIKVVERIKVDFGDEIHHGIYRDIKYKFVTKYGNKMNLRVKVESVVDGNGNSWKVKVSRKGKVVHVRIGDPNAYVDGVHIFQITYRVRRAITFFDDHDELWWEVTGHEWEIPIQRTTAVIKVPAKTDLDRINATCYSGVYGSTEQDCQWTLIPDGIQFVAGYLAPGEGLTTVIGIPKGIITKPSVLAEIQWFFIDNWLWILCFPLPFLAFLWLIIKWFRVGRDPMRNVSIMVRYEPPEKLTPAQMGTVMDERADISDITATIIDLAVRGFVKIVETESKKFVFLKDKDYALVLLREYEGADDISKFERKFLGDLFDVGKDNDVSPEDLNVPEGLRLIFISTLKNKFYSKLESLKVKLYTDLVRKKYFPRSPDSVRSTYFGIGLVFLIASAVFLVFRFLWPLIWATAPTGLMFMIFSPFMPRKTRKGAAAMLHAKGFELFVRRAEKDRIKRLAKDDPTVFQRLLPYAMVLGCADEWVDKFKDIFDTPPDWFVGTSPMTSHLFINNLGSAMNSMNSASTSRPRGSSASGGGSGFSGGGFSGGGFGGGGGGGW